jgi:hypothetical protein
MRSALLHCVGAVDLNGTSEHRTIADYDRCAVEDSGAGVEIDVRSKTDIDAVGAMKRRLDKGVASIGE